MHFLKQSTAFTYRHGPFVDETDGFTAETGLTINQVNIQISKNGGAFAQTSDASPVTAHDANGFYQIPLTVTDTNTLGPLKVQIAISGARIVTQEFMVLPANIYDSFVSGTDFQQTDTVQISGDATAADNLELQYDGTGVSGSSFPATQGQVNNIASIGSTEVVAPDSYTLTTGTLVTGTANNLLNEDGTYHTHNDTAGFLDLFYDFDVTAKGRATGVSISGYLQRTNDDIDVQIFNWSTSTYVTAATFIGQSGDTNIALNPVVTRDYTGPEGTANEGIVRVRFVGTGLSNATLALDQLIVSRILIPSRLGYTNDLVWINDSGSNDGTVLDVDGTESNPVNNLSDALVIFSGMGAAGYGLFPNTSLTLTFDATNLNFKSRGVLWNLDMNGQTVTGATIERARITGTMVNTGNRTRFEDQCVIQTVTLGNSIVQNGVLTASTMTLTDGAIVSVRRSVSSDITPIDFGSPTTNTVLELYDVIGFAEFRNTNANCEAFVFGLGELTLNVNCTGGKVTVGPDVNVIDNSGGAVTIIRLKTNPEAVAEISAIKAKTDRLTYTNGNDLDVNIKSINGNDIEGGGGTPAGYV